MDQMTLWNDYFAQCMRIVSSEPDDRTWKRTPYTDHNEKGETVEEWRARLHKSDVERAALMADQMLSEYNKRWRLG
jgi:hypothetical protein